MTVSLGRALPEWGGANRGFAKVKGHDLPGWEALGRVEITGRVFSSRF
ncbi:MAG: hypothetical protein HLUCCO07_07905 [Rhodobacteraceae bacterium HLUCCO07]|nr:MAG: hypothetical protein HLUCCO07_07905 [Rhodobacteraceae bacterium HLUCCO07]